MKYRTKRKLKKVFVFAAIAAFLGGFAIIGLGGAAAHRTLPTPSPTQQSTPQPVGYTVRFVETFRDSAGGTYQRSGEVTVRNADTAFTCPDDSNGADPLVNCQFKPLDQNSEG